MIVAVERYRKPRNQTKINKDNRFYFSVFILCLPVIAPSLIVRLHCSQSFLLYKSFNYLLN